MPVRNEPDWQEFRAILDEEIAARSKVNITIKRSVAVIIIACHLVALPVFVWTTIKLQKTINILKKENQTMRSASPRAKKELCIYCRQ